MSDNLRRFIGKEGKYQIPKGAIVELAKCWPKRKCLIRYKGQEIITFVSLLRKLGPHEIMPNLLEGRPFNVHFI